MDIQKENIRISNQLEKCFRRYEDYMKKACELSMRLTVLGFKSDKTLRNLLSAETTGNLLLREDPDEETCSSSEDDEDSHLFMESPSSPKQNNLNSEDQFLCTRSLIKSNWFWLKLEILKAKNNIRSLNKLLKSYESQSNNPIDNPHDGNCARTRQFLRKRKRKFIDISSKKVVRLLSPWYDEKALFDGSIRCSCKIPITGPCIICCGLKNKILDHTQFNSIPGSSVSILNCANSSDYHKKSTQLVSSIHPKLSGSSDIPPSLRIESRLVAPQLKPYGSSAGASSSSLLNKTSQNTSATGQTQNVTDRKQNQLHPRNVSPYILYMRPKILNRYVLNDDPSGSIIPSSGGGSGVNNSSVANSRQKDDYFEGQNNGHSQRWASKEVGRGRWLTEAKRQAADLRYTQIINKVQSDIEALSQVDCPKLTRLSTDQESCFEESVDNTDYGSLPGPEEDLLLGVNGLSKATVVENQIEEQHLLNDNLTYTD